MLSEVPVTCELWSEDDESSGSAFTAGVGERLAVGSQPWVKGPWWPPTKNSPFYMKILFHWPGCHRGHLHWDTFGFLTK